MPGTCPHGFATGTCLICAQLDLDRSSAKPALTKHRATLRSGPRVVPNEAPRTGLPASVKLVAAVIVVVAAIMVAWTVLHLVLVVLHILELIGVAVVAGYVGWLAGDYHGRHSARRS